MKKFFGLMAALIVSASAFAGGYKGDFQLMLGAGFDSISAVGKIANQDSKTTVETGLFTMNLETWHVFGSNDVFKFGFMFALDEGIGGTMSVKSYINGKFAEKADKTGIAARTGMFIAPAFSFFLGNAVRFNVAPGLSILFADLGSVTETYYGYRRTETYENFIGVTAVGPGIEIQAKFVPNAKVSPVIGYRFAANFAQDFYNLNSRTSSSTTTKADSVVVLTNTIQLGISWNW
ncbi:MAG: hypothetical protein KBT21_03140 [Treponema sp.]|nr:hypothetical protein [Candidatus Treponema merdequi]